MVIRSSRGAYLWRHACELLLLIVLAAPVLAIDFSTKNLCIVGVFLLVLVILSYRTDMASSLRVDEDGLSYLEGGRDRRFLAWSEIGEIVPRRFRGWPAEDALVVLARDGTPLLVAGVSMFDLDDVIAAVRFSRERVRVTDPVLLSPFTARANGRRRPELAPQRMTERLLASTVGGVILSAIIAAGILVFVKA